MYSSAFSVGLIFSVAWVLLAIPASVFLFLAYQRSRLSGFLWLCGSVVAWPLVARILTMVIGITGPRTFLSSSAGSPYLNPFLLLSLFESIVGGILLLASSMILYNQVTVLKAANVPAPAATPHSD